jgi:hypothetical protein
MNKHILPALVSLAMLAGCSQASDTTVANASQTTVSKTSSTVVSTEKDGNTRVDGTFQKSKSGPEVSTASVKVESKKTDATGESREHSTVVASGSSTDTGNLGYSQTDKNIVVTGSNVTRNFEANGQDLSISGNRNHITIKGKIHGLSVTGSENQVDAENPQLIDVKGTKNNVVYSGPAATVAEIGTDNRVTHR